MGRPVAVMSLEVALLRMTLVVVNELFSGELRARSDTRGLLSCEVGYTPQYYHSCHTYLLMDVHNIGGEGQRSTSYGRV